MIRLLQLVWLASLVTFLHVSVAAAPLKELLVGDPAPPLAVKEFVKGEPVKELAKGKVYVIEFWATWCGPCIKAIPHVSDLQAKHKNVVFIGVDVLESADDQVRAFVKRMGEKMNYRVALDAVDPQAAQEGSGVMAKTWLEASHRQGIPASMIVDATGRIAWIGHPMELDEPLEQVVAGKWDLAAAAKEFKAEIEAAKASNEFTAAIDKALEADKPEELLKVLDAGFAKHPQFEKEHGALKFNTLLAMEKHEQAIAYGKHLVEKVSSDDPNVLYSLASAVLTDDDDKPLDKLDAATGKFAVQATTQLAKVLASFQGADDEDRSVVQEMVAQAHFASGNPKEAVAAQEHAIKLTKGTGREKDPSLAAKLKKYQAGVKP